MATNKRFKKHFLVYFFAALLTVLAGIVSANQKVIAAQLDNWQVVPRPQGVTELYFADDKRLPVAVRVESNQSVEFVIHNLEHKVTSYQYKMVAIEQGSEMGQVLGTGAVQLDHNESRTISEPVKIPPMTAPRMTIQVEIEYQTIPFGSRDISMQHQTIRYWTDVVGLKV